MTFRAAKIALLVIVSILLLVAVVYLKKINDSLNPIIPTEQQAKAIKAAEAYAKDGYSREVFIELMTKEHSREDSVFAIDFLNIDWNKQAEKSAAFLKDMNDPSCDELEQLLSSPEWGKFTKKEARHGARSLQICSK